MCFRRFFFLSRFLILDFLYLLSVDESDSLDDGYDGDGYDSRSAGTCAFPFRFEYSVGCVVKYIFRVDDSVGCICGVSSGDLFR